MVKGFDAAAVGLKRAGISGGSGQVWLHSFMA